MRITVLVLLSACLFAVEEPAPKPIELGIRLDTQDANFDGAGLAVSFVKTGSLAAQLGVTIGDRLAQCNDVALSSSEDLRAILRTLEPEQAISLVVLRDGESLVLEGVIPKPPAPPAVDLADQQEDLMARVKELEKQPLLATVASLQKLAETLKEIEQNVPQAAEQFREHFPHGRFNVSVHIDIVSDAREVASAATEAVGQPNEIALPLEQPKDEQTVSDGADTE